MMKPEKVVFRWHDVGKLTATIDTPTSARVSYFPSASVILKTLVNLNKKPAKRSKSRT